MEDTSEVVNVHSTKLDHKMNDETVSNSFANKYSGLFGKNNQQNGTTLTKKTLGNELECSDNQQHGKPSKSATDRFRQAGIKARFVRRIEKIVDDRMTVKQIFNRYVENSTLHGFRFIFMKTFIVRRILWTILTVTMAAIFLSELKNSIELFLEYPFTTTSTMEYIPSLKFPAISICNLNSLQEPRIKSNQTWEIYEKALLPISYYNRTFHDIDGKELSKIINESSQDIHGIFQGCEWKSRDTAKSGIPNLCYGKNFTSYIDLHGQKCYTFNGERSQPALTLNETGLNMALKLEFDLQVNKTLLPLQEIGLKIIVHDQSETPLQQAGFVVSPGFQTIVELKVRKTKNLPGPYATKCGQQTLSFYKGYRQSRCFLEKLTKEVLQECNCKSLFMEDLDLEPNYPLCTLNETVSCLLPIVDGFDRKTNVECPVDCDTTTYGTSLSYARFIPNAPYKSSVPADGKASYIQKLQSQMKGIELEKYIEENVLVVQFFYQEMKEEKVGQEKSYDHFKLIGDVGGQLGLLLGASVLTLVEFVDLFFFTLYHQMLRLWRRKQRESEFS